MQYLKSLKEKITNVIAHLPNKALIGANLAVLILVIIVLSDTPLAGINNDKKNYNFNDPLIKQTAERLAQLCTQQDKDKCYSPEFKKLINQYNFSFAEQTLYAMQDIDEGAKSCHILAHFIAREATKKSPKDWQSLLDSVNVNTCGSGFLHGVLESHLGDDPATKFDGQLSNNICDRGDDDYRKRMCTHFMGHFFLVDTNDDVDKAVPKCGEVVDRLKFDCLDGLFMEHNQRIALNDHQLADLPTYTPDYAASLQKVCDKYEGVQSVACWTEMAEVYAKTFGYEAELIYDKCNAAPSKESAERCYFKGVVLLATYPYNVTKDKLVSICQFYYDDEQTFMTCGNNLISSLLHYSPKFTDRGVDFCSGISKYNDWCFRELGNQLNQFVSSPADRLVFCSSADEKYKNLCAKID
jgi:hypothetical protein